MLFVSERLSDWRKRIGYPPLEKREKRDFDAWRKTAQLPPLKK